ncbi:MAG: aminotransferase class III-fold pyridoxal phosphate-dependent enzyme [Actinobacteria bacterium]|nr:aminotransferase class III-fold pyridoxal phosphate-dependent enzyme [Actinomycetota bacterium]
MDPLIKKIMDFKRKDIPDYEPYLMLGGGTPGVNLVRGENIYVYDIDGNKYIDCTSQSWALHLGYCHPEINAAVSEQIKLSNHFHTGFYTVPRYLLAKKIAELFPDKMNRVLFTVGGGASIEAALKIAIINRPKAHNFISLYGGYHGTSFMTTGASLTGTYAYGGYLGGAALAHHSQNFIRVPAPYYYRPYFEVSRLDDMDEVDRRCLEALSMQIKYGSTGPVCALVMEPLQASGGQIIFSKKYLEGVRDICTKHGIILIWDCIQTAFGRIGDWSAANYYGVTPDIMVLGKSMGAGYPINAVVISDDIQGVKMDGIDLHTFGNNQVSQVAALKQIEIIERDNILGNVGKVGGYIRDNLLKLQKEWPQMGDIRALGFHIGIEFVKDRKTREADYEGCSAIRKTGFDNRIIFGVGGSGRGKAVLKIKPPLITTKEQADDILERFEMTLKQVY